MSNSNPISEAKELLKLEKEWNNMPHNKTEFLNKKTGEELTVGTWAARLRKARNLVDMYNTQIRIDFGTLEPSVDGPIPYSLTTESDEEHDDETSEDIPDGYN